MVHQPQARSPSPRVAASKLAAGIWTLRIEGESADPGIDVMFRQHRLDTVEIGSDAGDTVLTARLPVGLLSTGVHTVHAVLRETGEILASLHITSGEPVSDDMADELALLREELDLLKQAFRRHLAESSGSA